MRYMLKYGAACLLLLLALSSCRKEPVYDVVPEIEFRRVEQYHFVDTPFPQRPDITSLRDSIVLVIGFKDGDGNLGLSSNRESQDFQPPFNEGSEFEQNFHTVMYIKEEDPNNPGSSRFVPYPFPVPGFQFSGRFQRLSADERPETLEGEIKYSINEINASEFPLLQPGTVIKFDIFIYDRTTPVPNRSNTVTTDEITLFQPAGG
ncbi:hypothetical protein [Pontibacter sp. HSC-36F09]|uniref:hypothetical protein n=1 Tax=Pontibacter sp. HSC-36F09 TaxID=2910966 RepID=UPI00209DF205|nr:hypothetical protein [Pontibacter sp. HSC-36F09]MCP2045212.1 hypothetical protein [Pontibacter sp. HSC-36F09]